MPSIPLYASTEPSEVEPYVPNALPSLLQTPSGLAILEIQGTIHAPFPETNGEPVEPTQTPIGRLEFPLYDPSAASDDNKWMKRAYLYVGEHQRLTGEVKKLPKPLVVVGKRKNHTSNEGPDQMIIDTQEAPDEELEVLEIIRHKILFAGRPEPVSD